MRVRRSVVGYLVLAVVLSTSCARQDQTPEVTVVFMGQGQPVSYTCDEVLPVGRLSDGRPIYRCSIWSKVAPQRQ